jgi:hypothetical protein
MPPLRKKRVQTRVHSARLTGESFLLDQSSSLILACPLAEHQDELLAFQ